MTNTQLGLFTSPSFVPPKIIQVFDWEKKPFFALDIETTGLDAAANKVIELALVPFNLPKEQTINQLLFIEEPIPKEIETITGINDSMLKGKPKFAQIADKLLQNIASAEFIVAYNAKFDKPFVESELARVGKVLPNIPWIDPFVFICELDRYKKGKKLLDAAKRWGVELTDAHRAYNDALAAGELMLKLSNAIGINCLFELFDKQTVLFWQNAHSRSEFQKKQEWSINR